RSNASEIDRVAVLLPAADDRTDGVVLELENVSEEWLPARSGGSAAPVLDGFRGCRCGLGHAFLPPFRVRLALDGRMVSLSLRAADEHGAVLDLDLVDGDDLLGG